MRLFFVFMGGAILGSFLNVCVYRIPRGRSIILPRSFCPFCERAVLWFDNVTILSFLILRGRCRHCGHAIPARYLSVELITAASAVVLRLAFSNDAMFFIYSFFTLLLIAVTFIDIEHRLVPDVISLPGIAAGLALSSFFPAGKAGFSLAALGGSAVGALAGGASIFVMGFLGERVFREKAMEAGGAVGGGDLKLMAMIGAFLGWKMALLTFFMAPILGLAGGLYALFRKNEETIPYAPYLAAGAFVSLLFGERIIAYLVP